MKNTHLQHPEDSILTGDLSVLDWFSAPNSFISTKMDGAPAIVWGRNPANGKFFVGTKSVFNKVKIKIAHNHEEIDALYQGNQGKVARILHACFDCLPRTTSIIQGDFIGFGGSYSYRPNTVTYIFPEIIAEDIIICPHTVYGGGNDLRNVSASPLMNELTSTSKCLFVQPEVALHPHREDIADICAFAKQMSTLCEFVSESKATTIKKSINTRIREGQTICEDEIAQECDCDINLLRLWKLVSTIKEDLFMFIDEQDDIVCLIGNNGTLHEGYVITNQYGMFKVVDRQEFSRANFVMERNW